MTQRINTHGPSSYSSFAGIGEDNHILIHVLPSDGEHISPWKQYMHDLDDFFMRLYKYHQKSGFACLVFGQLLELIQIIYSVFLPIFFLNYIDYDILFKNKPPSQDPKQATAKVHIYDVIRSHDSVTIPPIQMFAIILALIFLTWKSVKVFHSTVVNLAIKQFYRDVLHINDCSSLSWQDVQTMIINSKNIFLAQDSHLTELDVHNRILRHTNYTIALINRGILPIYYRVPLIGETTFFTQSFLYNCQLLFFRGPFKCIFEQNWYISDNVKTASHRQLVARKLNRYILILATINLILFPVLLIWQILYFFYSNAALVKKDPVVLGLRNWSLYARWFCRHFNELEHQLCDRLNHAYKPAKNYMDAFTSPLVEIFARHIRFVAGSTFAILLLLTIYDEDVIQVNHLLILITGLWLSWCVAGAFIPSEIPPRFTKTELYEQILQNIHYVPHNYPPFTPQARSAMGELFQYKLAKLGEDLLSTLATPYIMIRHLRPRSLDIVDFFRTYTIDVPGTGDICVFSMMNIKENGNPLWQPISASQHELLDRGDSTGDLKKNSSSDSLKAQNQSILNESQSSSSLRRAHGLSRYETSSIRIHDHMEQFERETINNHAIPMRTEHGKLELSLINFKLQNPSWNPTHETQRNFINQVMSQAREQASSHQMGNQSCDNECQNLVFGMSSNQRSKSAMSLNDMDSSNPVNLSTLFLHNHARMQMSTNFESSSGPSASRQHKSATESDPLL